MTATVDAAPAAEPSFKDGQKLLKRFAVLMARRKAYEAALEADIAPLKAAADKKIAPIAAELAALPAKIEAWFNVHRGTILKGDLKSTELSGCVLGTQLSPPSLVFIHGGDIAAIVALMGKRLVKLLRRSPSLDKAAITKRLKEEPEGELAKLGFKLQPGADVFFVKPATHAGRKR